MLIHRARNITEIGSQQLVSSVSLYYGPCGLVKKCSSTSSTASPAFQTATWQSLGFNQLELRQPHAPTLARKASKLQHVCLVLLLASSLLTQTSYLLAMGLPGAEIQANYQQLWYDLCTPVKGGLLEASENQVSQHTHSQDLVPCCRMLELNTGYTAGGPPAKGGRWKRVSFKLTWDSVCI